jgi:hypothetical protein
VVRLRLVSRALRGFWPGVSVASMSALAAATQSAPTNWATFWAYAGVVVAVGIALVGVMAGYVRLRLNATERLLAGKLDTTQEALSGKLDATERVLSVKLDATERLVDARVGALERLLPEKIDAESALINQRVQDVADAVSAQVVELSGRVDRQQERLDEPGVDLSVLSTEEQRILTTFVKLIRSRLEDKGDQSA